MSGVPRIASSSTKGTLKREKMQQDFVLFSPGPAADLQEASPIQTSPEERRGAGSPPSVPTHLPGALCWLQGSEGSRAAYVDLGLQRLLGYKRVFGFGRHGAGTKCLRCGRLVSGICLGHGGGPPSNNVFREDEFHNCCSEAFFSLGPSTFGLNQLLTHQGARSASDSKTRSTKKQGGSPKGQKTEDENPSQRKPKGPRFPKKPKAIADV